MPLHPEQVSRERGREKERERERERERLVVFLIVRRSSWECDSGNGGFDAGNIGFDLIQEAVSNEASAKYVGISHR